MFCTESCSPFAHLHLMNMFCVFILLARCLVLPNFDVEMADPDNVVSIPPHDRVLLANLLETGLSG